MHRSDDNAHLGTEACTISEIVEMYQRNEKGQEDAEFFSIPDILTKYPEYATTSRLDELRATEYAYLDKQDHVYLDYTGSGLAAYAQHRAHQERLAETLCGNPHSVNPTSEATTQLIEKAKSRVLAHLNASPKEYAVIFTANATGAARLVGEAYPFKRNTKLILTSDNHNSINGLRIFAKRRGAKTIYVPTQAPELRIDQQNIHAVLGHRCRLNRVFKSRRHRRGLFAYPAQSNFSGVRHPLSWVSMAQTQGYDVLLDTAAYLPTATLDLSIIQPEFLIISWYKLFGYPTGVGCLIAKREALERLDRPWFSGGTIRGVSVTIPWHEMAPDESAFEDGTLNFLSIPDVAVGLDWISGIGISTIETRVRYLTGWFLDRLLLLRHKGGSPMVIIYGPTNTKQRGGTITFNFLDARGSVVDERLVAKESAAARVSLRTGCFCNPGAAEDAFNLTKRKLIPLFFSKTKTLDEFINLIGLPSGGAVRVSFGIASTEGDIDRFFEFAVNAYQNRVTNSEGLPPRDRC